ncbi:MAG: hypothetical protein GPOALKHO_000657 [Sodalis sp.]|nr:MAG: hypothetical protein GPOALKHO_000657 [Sodalis sp.]
MVDTMLKWKVDDVTLLLQERIIAEVVPRLQPDGLHHQPTMISAVIGMEFETVKGTDPVGIQIRSLIQNAIRYIEYVMTLSCSPVWLEDG